MRTCIILNPNAGSAEAMPEVDRAFARFGEHAVFRTEKRGDGESLARQALTDGYERVIAAGGDGTVNEVLNGIADHLDRVEFGVLPLGTGNDFARALAMPIDDPLGALDILVTGQTRRVDIARIERPHRRHFLNTAAAGFTAKVGENIGSSAKTWWGAIAYLWAGAKTLPELEQFDLRLTLDDEALEIAAYTLVISNGTTIGGGIPVCPGGQLDDGEVEVFIVPVMPMSRLVVVVPQILAGKQDGIEELICHRASRIVIECDPPMRLNVDGEPLGETPCEVITLPQALRVICGHGSNDTSKNKQKKV